MKLFLPPSLISIVPPYIGCCTLSRLLMYMDQEDPLPGSPRTPPIPLSMDANCCTECGFTTTNIMAFTTHIAQHEEDQKTDIKVRERYLFSTLLHLFSYSTRRLISFYRHRKNYPEQSQYTTILLQKNACVSFIRILTFSEELGNCAYRKNKSIAFSKKVGQPFSSRPVPLLLPPSY